MDSNANTGIQSKEDLSQAKRNNKGAKEMKDTYRLNKFGEVAPYIGGIKSNSTREFRSLTGFEAQLIKKNRELEEELKSLMESLEKAVELLKELIDDYKSYYHLLPNNHRKTPEEYFKTEIDFIKEQEK
jgi:coenzyme F420-reducing hydrogenase alpha subunit